MRSNEISHQHNESIGVRYYVRRNTCFPLCSVLLDNAARLPFVVRILAPSHDRAQRTVNAFFYFTKSYHTTNDPYFKDFEEFVIGGLSTLEGKDRRITNIAPGSISQFEYVPRGMMGAFGAPRCASAAATAHATKHQSQ